MELSLDLCLNLFLSLHLVPAPVLELKKNTLLLKYYKYKYIYKLGLHRILNWPDIRPICLPDIRYPAGYPAE